MSLHLPYGQAGLCVTTDKFFFFFPLKQLLQIFAFFSSSQSEHCTKEEEGKV